VLIFLRFNRSQIIFEIRYVSKGVQVNPVPVKSVGENATKREPKQCSEVAV